MNTLKAKPLAEGDSILGRDNELEQLYNRLMTVRVLTYHGPTGAGKTSVIKAGLVPRLTERNMPVETVRPTEARFEQLIAEYCESGDKLKLLVVDQSEELFHTQLYAKKEFRRAFDALVRNKSTWLLLVVRDDFLGALLGLLPSEFQSRLSLPLLTLSAAKDVVSDPRRSATWVGTAIEKAAIESAGSERHYRNLMALEDEAFVLPLLLVLHAISGDAPVSSSGELGPVAAYVDKEIRQAATKEQCDEYALRLWLAENLHRDGHRTQSVVSGKVSRAVRVLAHDGYVLAFAPGETNTVEFSHDAFGKGLVSSNRVFFANNMLLERARQKKSLSAYEIVRFRSVRKAAPADVREFYANSFRSLLIQAAIVIGITTMFSLFGLMLLGLKSSADSARAAKKEESRKASAAERSRAYQARLYDASLQPDTLDATAGNLENILGLYFEAKSKAVEPEGDRSTQALTYLMAALNKINRERVLVKIAPGSGRIRDDWLAWQRAYVEDCGEGFQCRKADVNGASVQLLPADPIGSQTSIEIRQRFRFLSVGRSKRVLPTHLDEATLRSSFFPGEDPDLEELDFSDWTHSQDQIEGISAFSTGAVVFWTVRRDDLQRCNRQDYVECRILRVLGVASIGERIVFGRLDGRAFKGRTASGFRVVLLLRGANGRWFEKPVFTYAVENILKNEQGYVAVYNGAVSQLDMSGGGAPRLFHARNSDRKPQGDFNSASVFREGRLVQMFRDGSAARRFLGAETADFMEVELRDEIAALIDRKRCQVNEGRCFWLSDGVSVGDLFVLPLKQEPAKGDILLGFEKLATRLEVFKIESERIVQIADIPISENGQEWRISSPILPFDNGSISVVFGGATVDGDVGLFECDRLFSKCRLKHRLDEDAGSVTSLAKGTDSSKFLVGRHNGTVTLVGWPQPDSINLSSAPITSIGFFGAGTDRPYVFAGTSDGAVLGVSFSVSASGAIGSLPPAQVMAKMQGPVVYLGQIDGSIFVGDGYGYILRDEFRLEDVVKELCDAFIDASEQQSLSLVANRCREVSQR